MKKILSNPLLSLAARLVVGLVFVAAAVDKIAVPDVFAKSISNYQIVPLSMLHIIALTLPWVELIVGLMLLFGIRLRASAAIAAGLLVVFILAVSWALMQDYNINCGCFAQTPEAAEHSKVGLPKILENTGMTLLCAYIFFFPVQKLTVEGLAVSEQQLASR